MKTIEIDRINMNDRRFCISYPLHDEALLESIRKVGIIQPVLLLNTTPPVVVAGFKRIMSASTLGIREAPYAVVDIDERKALVYAIHDNIGRGLNIVEKAHAVEKMLNSGFSTDDIREIIALLLPDGHDRALEELAAISGAEEPLKDFILIKGLSMKNIRSLLLFTAEERGRIMDMLGPIHTTESFIREILEMLHLVKIKHGNIDFGSMQGMPDAQGLRKSLKRIVNPMLTSLEGRLDALKRQCSLPPGIDIKVDPFFEKGYIDVSIRAKTDEEVDEAVKRVEGLLDKGYIRSIIELTKG